MQWYTTFNRHNLNKGIQKVENQRMEKDKHTTATLIRVSMLQREFESRY